VTEVANNYSQQREAPSPLPGETEEYTDNATVHEAPLQRLQRLQRDHESLWGRRGYKQRCVTWECVLARSPNLGSTALRYEFMTPMTPLLFADYYLERDTSFSAKWVQRDDRFGIPLSRSNCSTIARGSVVHVEASLFGQFRRDFLPIITNPIVLITGRWNLPQVHKSPDADFVLNHSNILHWFSQNPIYRNSEKYTAIPYGFHPDSPELLRLAKELQVKSKGKDQLISMTGLNRETHPSRKLLPDLASKTMSYHEILRRSKFVISPQGDRPDCYRHWECVAFSAVPMTNTPEVYSDILGPFAMITTIEKMIIYLKNSTTAAELDGFYPRYQESAEAKKDMLSGGYWYDRIRSYVEKEVASQKALMRKNDVKNR
jgi:hypothetical protein